jgi:hypothetical protein
MARPVGSDHNEEIWVAWLDNYAGQYEVMYRINNVSTGGWSPDITQQRATFLSDSAGYSVLNPTGNGLDAGLSLVSDASGNTIKAYWQYY